MWVDLTSLDFADLQVPIQAGHEFVITTDPAFAEAGTAEQIFMDYVGPLDVRWIALTSRPTSPK
jgi:pyruvate kinase